MSAPVVVPSAVADTETAWSGSGVLDDLVGCAQALESGAWIDAAVSGLSLGAGVVGAAIDPVSAAVSWGVGWVLDHVWPLDEILDGFAGDADTVAAYGAAWSALAAQLDEVAGRYGADVARDTAGMHGSEVSAYLAASGAVAGAAHVFARTARAVGDAVALCAKLVRVVHDLVRDLIAAIVGDAVASGSPLGASVRLARRVANAAAHVAPLVDGIARTVRALLQRADEVLDALLRSRADLRGYAGSIDTARWAPTTVDKLGYFATAVTPFVPPEPAPAPAPAPAGVVPPGGGGRRPSSPSGLAVPL